MEAHYVVDCDTEELITRINRSVYDKEWSEKGYGFKTRNVKVGMKYEHRILPSVSLLTHARATKFLKTSPCATGSSMTVAQLARNMYESD